MIQFVLPIAIAALAGTAYVVANQPKKGTMTPERQSILDTALSSTAEPDKLRALAKVFREEGLPLQAELLEKRAALRELPADVKEGRKAAFRAGMASKNPDAVRALANEFEKEGATGAAAALRTYAFSLEHPAQVPGAGLGLPNTGNVADAAKVAAAAQAAAAAAGFPNTTVDGHGTGIVDPAQAAADLVRRQEALPDPTTSEAAAEAAVKEMARAAEQAKLDAIDFATNQDSPEAAALASNLASLPIFAPVQTE